MWRQSAGESSTEKAAVLKSERLTCSKTSHDSSIGWRGTKGEVVGKQKSSMWIALSRPSSYEICRTSIGQAGWMEVDRLKALGTTSRRSAWIKRERQHLNSVAENFDSSEFGEVDWISQLN